MKGKFGQQGDSAMESELEPLRERTKKYALRIIRLVGSLPATSTAQILGKQLLRSGTSVGANYREGFRARSDAEIVAKFGICLQELDESCYWIELLGESQIVDEKALAPLLDETNQLISIFVVITKRLSKGLGRR